MDQVSKQHHPHFQFLRLHYLLYFFTSCKSNVVNFKKIIHHCSFRIYLDVSKMNKLEINIKNIAGAAAASSKSCDA